MKPEPDTPSSEQRFRYWVEVRDLADGTTRMLPLTCATLIPIPTRRQPDVGPSRVELRVRDGARTWIAASLEDLAAQLRVHYPDGAFERTLKVERDRDAERQHREALDALARILVRAALQKADS